MAKLLIRRDEMILLKNSEAGKNFDLYGNLFATLQTYDVLSEDEFYKNQTLDDKARAVILNNKKILFDEIKNEWIGIGCNDEATGEIRCQLCRTKNKLVFYIHNKLNDNELNVGSECIKKFPGIENVAKIRRTHNEQQKYQAEVKRRIEFDEIDLANINYIKESEEWFKNFKILLPYKLFNDIKTILYNLNSLKTTYIKSGGEITHVKQQYFEFKEILEKCKTEAENIYEVNKGHILICRKELADWLNVNHHDIWEAVMKNGGLLNSETLKYCYYTKFVQSHLKRFNARISDEDISIIGMNGPLIRLMIKNSDYIYPLYFGINCNVFMQNIGCYCLTNKNYYFGKKELVNISVEQTNSNFDAMCNRIMSPLERIGLQIERSRYTDEKYYVRLPKITRTSKWSDRVETTELGYKKIAESAIFTKFSDLVFASDEEIEIAFSRILSQLNRTTKWLSKDEKDKMEEISKSLSIQQQREFVPYA